MASSMMENYRKNIADALGQISGSLDGMCQELCSLNAQLTEMKEEVKHLREENSSSVTSNETVIQKKSSAVVDAGFAVPGIPESNESPPNIEESPQEQDVVENQPNKHEAETEEVVVKLAETEDQVVIKQAEEKEVIVELAETEEVVVKQDETEEVVVELAETEEVVAKQDEPVTTKRMTRRGGLMGSASDEGSRPSSPRDQNVIENPLKKHKAKEELVVKRAETEITSRMTRRGVLSDAGVASTGFHCEFCGKKILTPKGYKMHKINIHWKQLNLDPPKQTQK